MINKLSDTVMIMLLVWLFMVMTLNFLIPHSWFFEYISLEAEEEVCRSNTQAVTGTRWSLFSNPSSGVDQIFPVGVNVPSDRYEWPQGYYEAGETTSTWRPVVSVQPGEYEWRATQLRINLLYIFPIYLDEDERPVSNTFIVKNC